MDGFRALCVGTSLKRDGGQRHARLLMHASAAIPAKERVAVEHLHLLGRAASPGSFPT